MIKSFARRHDLLVKEYGSSVSISSINLDGKDIRVHLVMHGGISYTAVYQHEEDIDKNAVEKLWNSLEPTFRDGVSITFGEIPNLWRNSYGRMRLCKDFAVSAVDEKAFDETVLGACSDLVKIREILQFCQGLDCEAKSKSKPQPKLLFKQIVENPPLNLMDELPFEMDNLLFDMAEEDQEVVLKPAKGGGFADVAGLDDLKKKISDEVIWPLTNKAKADMYRITPPSGMLLYGPPGCGKTFFARKLAEETGFSFKMVFPSDIGGMMIHETHGKVAKLFEEAKSKAPCIICFDEIDAMIPRRTSTPGMEYQNTEVNEFLVQMNSCGEKGVFVIGTTNNMGLIDPAALRTGRLDYHVEIPKPDLIQRERLFRKCMERRPAETRINYKALAQVSAELTASDISFVVNGAALEAAKADMDISFKAIMDSLTRWRQVRATPSHDADMVGRDKEEQSPVVPLIPKKVLHS